MNKILVIKMSNLSVAYSYDANNHYISVEGEIVTITDSLDRIAIIFSIRDFIIKQEILKDNE